MNKPDKIPTNVVQQEGSVEITFSDDIPKELIEKQVEECQSGTYECCTPVFRSNVKSFELIPDAKLKVRVTGDITKEQITRNILSCVPKLDK